MPKLISLLFCGLSIVYLLLVDLLAIGAGVLFKVAPIMVLMMSVWGQITGKLRAGMLLPCCFLLSVMCYWLLMA